MPTSETFVSRPPTPDGQRKRWTKFGDIFFRERSITPEECGGDQKRMESFCSEISDNDSAGSSSPGTWEARESDSWAQPHTPTDPAEQETLVFTPDVTPLEGLRTSSTVMPTSRNIRVELPRSTLNNPRSLYSRFDPGAPMATEQDAVAALLNVLKQDSPDLGDFIEFDLHEFTIYLDSSIYSNEMRPLQHLATRAASDKFYFDGILGIGEKSYFIKKAPFRELPIGNYCDVTEHSVGDQIWIRSELNQAEEIYYKLRKPAPEYERYWAPFFWIADLAKHVVDYCSHLLRRKHCARLNNFQEDFSTYLIVKHKNALAFQHWYAAHGAQDFRTAIVANIEFLWKEAIGLPLPYRKITMQHAFWSEAKGGYYLPMVPPSLSILDEPGTTEDSTTSEAGMRRKRKAKSKEDKAILETIVTPYIYDLFSHMGFETIMKSISPADIVHDHHLQQIQSISSAHKTFYQGENQSRGDEGFLAKIQAGDVISTPPDDEGTGTKWKRETSRHHGSDYVWYGMVQKVHVAARGHRSFDVIWMYQPRDTPCALMKYAWSNELFLSDSCTCETAHVDGRDVLATHKVAWFGDSSSVLPTDFFVRQTYLAGERCWVALDENHLVCDHHKQIKHGSVEHGYKQGDTVLAKLPNSNRLDAFIVEGVPKKRQKRWVRLRILLRRNEVDKLGDHPANELVYTDQLVEMEPESIVRHCMIRVFRIRESIPAPYDRGGTGDAFYFTHREPPNNQNGLEPIKEPSSFTFRQGFYPDKESIRKLRGLDLFCGGGNFGRGIEDGDGVEMRWANDIASNAIHSYMANCNSSTCKPFLGSVDDLLDRALNGSPEAPKPGDVQFISGGSPCQGFSRLTQAKDQKSLKQRKNRSLVASFASFVDLYRPQYGLLENVQSMVKAKDNREECFFSQLVCSIVGLGYQVRIIYADAWSYGAPQSRCRVFLSFAVPGVQMPKAPALTHSHPPGTRMGSLGKMSSGQPFGERIHAPTPFKFVSASESTGKLPDIRDGKADYCVGFPDHRISIGFTPRLRNQMHHIPFQPFGLNFDKAYFGYEDSGRRAMGTISTADRDYCFPNPNEHRMQTGSKGWGRIHPHGIFRTVVTQCSPTDRRTGFVNHWQQPRPLTVLEARRAQGFLDHEVITGKPAQQWHIVGNSVARQVALALGLAIREAWLGTLYDESFSDPITMQPIDQVLEVAQSAAYDVAVAKEAPGFYGNIVENHREDSFTDDSGGPISTPATSTGGTLEERLHLKQKYGYKRHSTRSLMEECAKRLRMDEDVAIDMDAM